MSKTFFTSDHHIHHSRIIKFENRPFKDVEEMEREFVSRWNNKVTDKDMVYLLGDLSFGNSKQTLEFVSQLRGNKYYIFGNHDKPVRKNTSVKNKFIWCKDYAEVKISINGKMEKVTLTHYPFDSWNRSFHGSMSIHGHVHSIYPTSRNDKRLNASCDINNFEPCTIEELIVNNKIWWEKYDKSII
jgi:calcineurin-like phosphoesterase family protein